MPVFSPGNGINNMAGYIADRIPLKFSQARAGMVYGPVVCTRLWTVAAQEYSSIIGYLAADNRDQFRIYWW